MTMDDQKFKDFTRRDLVYSCVNGHDILATVLTPNTLEDQNPSLYPLLVYWHGGGFIVGHRMYGPWWPTWSLELALSQGAIIISPDYRLLPEANGTDILADVETFASWMQHELPLIADQESWHALPDLSRVVLMGQSSGGWLAMQMALLFSSNIAIRAVVCVSSPLAASSNPAYTIPRPRSVMGAQPLPPRQSEELIRQYIRNIKPGAVRSEGDPIEMWQLLTSIFPPPMWIIHSKQDSVVPVDCSTEFAKAVEKRHLETPVLVTLRSGDHDFNSLTRMNEPWVQEGCRFICGFWLD
ncbi:Alpha/Beta hydrolase protein [Mariannaea sp. PMI_226]|nr:Alpha/Beta hydrolase protein [Mariannaea sp. PMI_226]